MRRKGFGRIVNIGSIHSLVASPYKSAYVAAKHGLVGFSKTIALETRDCDITINTVCPSYVKTPLVDAQIDALAAHHELTREQVIEEIMLKPMPKRQFIGLDELAGTVDFLLSPTGAQHHRSVHHPRRRLDRHVALVQVGLQPDPQVLVSAPAIRAPGGRHANSKRFRRGRVAGRGRNTARRARARRHAEEEPPHRARQAPAGRADARRFPPRGSADPGAQGRRDPDADGRSSRSTRTCAAA